MAVISYLANTVIGLYSLVVLVTVLLSLLLSFNVLSRHNQAVDAIWRAGLALTEPVLRPIRNVLPAFGGIDFSPWVLLVGLRAAQIGLNTYIFFPMMRAGF